MNALERFKAGFAPPNWRRDPAADGIAFVHEERGVRLGVEAADVEAREPGLDATRWKLFCTRAVDGGTVRDTLGRAPDRETALETLYKQMYSINSSAREAENAGEDLALPKDAFDAGDERDPRRRGADSRRAEHWKDVDSLPADRWENAVDGGRDTDGGREAVDEREADRRVRTEER